MKKSLTPCTNAAKSIMKQLQSNSNNMAAMDTASLTNASYLNNKNDGAIKKYKNAPEKNDFSAVMDIRKVHGRHERL